mmetsp:Transcript_113913/g.332862  ORF Transcript_113913/g.332862 Transcript_113913/m.332862 type:complete len:220 (+) Transcript_113913:472-1131(+)
MPTCARLAGLPMGSTTLAQLTPEGSFRRPSSVRPQALPGPVAAAAQGWRLRRSPDCSMQPKLCRLRSLPSCSRSHFSSWNWAGSAGSSQFCSQRPLAPAGAPGGFTSRHLRPPRTLLRKPSGVSSHFWSVLTLQAAVRSLAPASPRSAGVAPATSRQRCWPEPPAPTFRRKPSSIRTQRPEVSTCTSSHLASCTLVPLSVPGRPATSTHLPERLSLRKP